jgi:hypothetical protein
MVDAEDQDGVREGWRRVAISGVMLSAMLAWLRLYTGSIRSAQTIRTAD